MSVAWDTRWKGLGRSRNIASVCSSLFEHFKKSRVHSHSCVIVDKFHLNPWWYLLKKFAHQKYSYKYRNTIEFYNIFRVERPVGRRPTLSLCPDFRMGTTLTRRHSLGMRGGADKAPKITVRNVCQPTLRNAWRKYLRCYLIQLPFSHLVREVEELYPFQKCRYLPHHLGHSQPLPRAKSCWHHFRSVDIQNEKKKWLNSLAISPSATKSRLFIWMCEATIYQLQNFRGEVFFHKWRHFKSKVVPCSMHPFLEQILQA